jgi:hypothetical protein
MSNHDAVEAIIASAGRGGGEAKAVASNRVRRKRWSTPQVITAEVDDETAGGTANLPEASGGVLSS